MQVMICISVVTSALARRCANKKEAITELKGHGCDLYTHVYMLYIHVYMYASCDLYIFLYVCM